MTHSKGGEKSLINEAIYKGEDMVKTNQQEVVKSWGEQQRQLSLPLALKLRVGVVTRS